MSESRSHEEVDDFLSSTFNVVLRVEERALDNRFTKGLSITEIHTLEAIGYSDRNPMNVVANRLNVTMATLTIAINKLVGKGFVRRERSTVDRRKVLVSLTKEGRKVYRVHRLFHQSMVNEAVGLLTEEEEHSLVTDLGKVRGFFEELADRQSLMYDRRAVR